MKNWWDKGGCSSQGWDGQSRRDKGRTCDDSCAGETDKGTHPSYSSATMLEIKPKWPNDKLIPMEAHPRTGRLVGFQKIPGEELVQDASLLKAWKGAFQ